MHNSRTKAKGKMNLFMMQAPETGDKAKIDKIKPIPDASRNGPPFIYRQGSDPYMMYPGFRGGTKFDTLNSSMKNDFHNDPAAPHHQPNYSSIIEEIPQQSTNSNQTHNFGSPIKGPAMMDEGDSPLVHGTEVDETDDEIYKHIR